MTHRSVPRFRIDHDRARDRDVLSAATRILASVRGCGPDCAFDELIDVANRNHVGVVDTARRLVSATETGGPSEPSLPREWRPLQEVTR